MADPRFPKLNRSQLNRLQQCGSVEQFDDRTTLFEQGELQYDFFAILKGKVKVIDPRDTDNHIVEHGKGEFTGDSGMLSNRSAQFDVVALPGAKVIRLKPKALKDCIARNSDISDILLNAFMERQHTVLNTMKGGIKILGSGSDDKTYEIRDFLEKNHIWHSFLDTDEHEETRDLLESFDLCEDDLPVLINANNKVCKTPTLAELATYAGVLMEFDDRVFDVLIVGAGPGGLGASVYAASEGLDTVTIDSSAPGGQAGKSSKIENYLGFPTGISGTDLANRAYVQAQKFGCNISIPHKAHSLSHDGHHFTVQASNGKTIETRAIVIATGANYNRLPLDNIWDYEGSGVYYSATGMDVSSCENEVVAVVGAGNSAGQAAMFLSNHARELHMIVRGDDLGSKMSDYLVQRIHAKDNIHLHLESNVTAMHGDDHLDSITVESPDGTNTYDMHHLFCFIGASPCTDWLNESVDMDEKGFIHTGADVRADKRVSCGIFDKRDPLTLESNIPGLFAVGDVRKGSVKRVASAVGEGAMVVSQVHQFLADYRQLHQEVDEPVAVV